MAASNMKTFQVAQREHDGKKVSFKLSWTDGAGKDQAETFEGDPADIAPITLMQLPNVVETSNLQPVLDILKQAMGRAEYARFDAFCKDPAHLVDVMRIVECMQFFVEENVGLPTEPSNS